MALHAKAWFSIFFALCLVGCDHATKIAAQSRLDGRVVDLVPGVLDLRYTENHDTAFTIFGGGDSPMKTSLLTAFGIIALLFVLFAWWRRAQSKVESFGFALIGAGAIGNVIDRARLGYVIDFIHLRHWPVFNIADAAIVCGVILLGWSQWRNDRGSAESA